MVGWVSVRGVFHVFRLSCTVLESIFFKTYAFLLSATDPARDKEKEEEDEGNTEEEKKEENSWSGCMMAFSGAAGFAAGVENGQVDESRLFWFPHETEVWLLGEVQEHHDEGTLTIVSDEGTFEIDSSKLHPYNSSHSEYVEDIAGMNNLHEAPLLDLLRRRFHAEDIYVSRSEQGQNL